MFSSAKRRTATAVRRVVEIDQPGIEREFIDVIAVVRVINRALHDVCHPNIEFRALGRLVFSSLRVAHHGIGQKHELW
jgi:hypothetical protein